VAPPRNRTEVTDLAELRRHLEWRESELDALFSGGPVGLALFDEGLRHVRINPTLARLNGHAVEAHFGRTLRQLVPELAPVVEPKLQRVVTTGAPIFEDQVTRPASEPVHAEVSYLPLLLRDRSVRGVAAVVRDLSDIKRVQEALVDRMRFERLFGRLAGQLGEATADLVDAAVREAIEEVCNELGFIRGSVVQVSDDGSLLEVSHEWGEEGTEALASRARDAELRWLRAHRSALMKQVPVVSRPKGSGAVVTDGESVEVRLEDRSAARRRCEQVGLRGSVAVPIRGRGLRGAIVFHSDDPGPVLSEEGTERLTLIGQAVFDALSARVAEEERRAAIAQIRKLRGSIPPPGVSASRGPSIVEAVERVRTTEGLREVVRRLEAVASTTATVLLCGESGVGKELIAQFIHARSRRARGPLVRVNCAAVAPELFESEFFGHAKGAFTGAHRDRQGRFELAHRGTLLLDEVGEIPPALQAKLLRVLQEGQFERVGDERTRHADVRVIAATNRDLAADVDAGRFRRDLYHRLSVFPVVVPPLRKRRQDIVALAHHFLEEHADREGRAGLALTEAHEALLLAYDWPGNVRELANVIQRAVILSPEPPLRLEAAMPSGGQHEGAARPTRPFKTADELRQQERENLLAALAAAGWRVSGPGGAAELLGVAPSTLRDRMKSHGIRRPR
jgi:PAS domain S-box-containing protein